MEGFSSFGFGPGVDLDFKFVKTEGSQRRKDLVGRKSWFGRLFKNFRFRTEVDGVNNEAGGEDNEAG